MIFGTEVLPAGNAVRLHIRPPAGTTSCVLLRREDEDFVGPVDPGAVLLASWEGAAPAVVLDTSNLVNGTPYVWRVYYAPSDTHDTTSATPAAGYTGFGADAVLVLMDRLRLGLAIEVGRGALHPKAGTIPVQNSPPLWDQTPFPVVTAHLSAVEPDSRGLGEVLEADVIGLDSVTSTDGWLERSSVTVVGWSLNPDERIALRRAIKRILQANWAVFEALGLSLIEWTQRDQEDMERYAAPVFQAVTDFRCVSAGGVTSETPKIHELNSQVVIHV